MTNYSVHDVSEFIASSPEESQPHLKKMRTIIQETIPQAEEKMGYGKPFYKFSGRWLVGMDVYKQHLGFEIWEGQLLPEIKKELEVKGNHTGNKTVKIRYDQPVPAEQIKNIIFAQVKLAKEKIKKNKK